MKDSLNRFTVGSVSLTSNANVLLLFDSHIWEGNNQIQMKEWEGLRSGSGDRWYKSGLVWVKESRTSVLVIILRIPKKNETKKSPNKIQENKEGEPRNKRSQYKVRCFIVLIVLKLKQTNDSPFRLLSSFPVKSWSPWIIARTMYTGNWTWNLSDVNFLSKFIDWTAG